MQLLTHILLINVKIPGNAALFFNIVMPIFRFDFFTDVFYANCKLLTTHDDSLQVYLLFGFCLSYSLLFASLSFLRSSSYVLSS